MAVNTDMPEDVVLFLMNSWSQGWDSLLNGFDCCLAEDCIYANVGFPTWTGKATIMAALRAAREEFALERIMITVRNVLQDGEHVVVERFEHWFDASGQPLFPDPEPALGIFAVRHGKISEYRDYFDPRTFLRLLERNQSRKEAFFAKPGG